MKLDQFVTETDLLNKVEIEKVRLLGYYYLRRDEISEFAVKDISNWFQTLNLPSPNKSRLRSRLQKSRQFIRGSSDALFCLHAKEIAELDVLYLEQFYSNEEVTSSDTILPAALYLKTRGYIETLAKQINASFENNIFDGCAVLMRRLIEILLILSYKHL